MRKWMRERMTRRKKGDGAAPKEQENTPVPLQPRYFEGAEASEKTPAVSASREPEPESQIDNDSQAVVLAASEYRTGTRTEGRPSPPRRARGGRRRGARPKVAGDAPRSAPHPATAAAATAMS